MPQFDRHELKMLDLLQRRGRMPVSELAGELGLSTTPCARRFDGLQAAGVIAGFAARLDRHALGLSIEVFVQVNLSSHSDGTPERFRADIERREAVIACWAMTGDQDFLLHVLVPDVDALNHLVMNELLQIPGVRDVKTNLVLDDVKPSGPLPLGHLRPC